MTVVPAAQACKMLSATIELGGLGSGELQK
jgi:hypothetical protein